MKCLLHAAMLSMPRLKLPNFHQVTITHIGNTKSLLDTTNCCSLAHSCMSDLLPKALMHHHVKGELTDITLDATCLHVDMRCHWHLFQTYFCLLGDMLSVLVPTCVCLCVWGYLCPVYPSNPCKILRATCSNAHSQQWGIQSKAQGSLLATS